MRAMAEVETRILDMAPTEDGIYEGVPYEVYEAIARDRWSHVKEMRRAPAFFQMAKRGLTKKESKDLLLGTATHVLLLEPHLFVSRFAIWDGERRGKKYEDFKEQNSHRDILTTDERDLVYAMVKAIRSDEYAAPFFVGASEVTVLFTLQGVRCKCRIDRLPDGKAIVDLKTTWNASPDEFARSAYNMGYFGQGSFYRQGFAWANGGVLLPYIFVAVEKEPPHIVQVYGVPDAIMDSYDTSNLALLQRIVGCRAEYGDEMNENVRWPGYSSNGPLDLELPQWAKVA